MERECPACGLIYHADETRLRNGRQTTCSRRCSYRLRGENQQRRVRIRCATCGVEITRSPRQVKAKHGASYCSRRCHYTGRTLGLTGRVVTNPYVRVAPLNPEAHARTVATRKARDNYRHSDDTRLRLREATARAIAEGRVASVSRCEDVVAEVLDRLGVGYRRQVAIRGERGRYVAAVDFLLGDGRAVEVNGTFWHADPRVYPNGPAFPAQRRTAACWDRKVNALATLGIPVVIIWEIDLAEDPTQAVSVALAAV